MATITLLQLYATLGKLNDCKRLVPSCAEIGDFENVRYNLEVACKSLANDDYVLPCDVDVEITRHLSETLKSADVFIKQLPQQTPALNNFFNLRDRIVHFYLKTEKAVADEQIPAFEHAYVSAMTAVVARKPTAKFAGLAQLLTLRDEKHALALTNKDCQNIVEDLLAFPGIVEQKLQFRLIPWIDALQVIVSDKSFLREMLQHPEMDQHLTTLFALPAFISACLDEMNVWVLNFSTCDTRYDTEHFEQVFCLPRLTHRQQLFASLPGQQAVASAIALLSKTEFEIRATREPLTGFGWAYGETKAAKMVDRKWLRTLRTRCAVFLTLDVWNPVDESHLAHESATKTMKRVRANIDAAVKRIHALAPRQNTATAESLDAQSDELGLIDSIVRVDRSQPHTFSAASCYSPDAATASAEVGLLRDFQAELDDNPERPLKQHFLQGVLNKELQEAMKRHQIEYINSRPNLKHFYDAVRNQFSSMYIGFKALSSKLIRPEDRGFGTLASFASSFTGPAAVLFTALAVYSRHRTKVDSKKISLLGVSNEVNAQVQAFAIELTLMYEYQLRMINQAADRTASKADDLVALGLVPRVARKVRSKVQDDDDDVDLVDELKMALSKFKITPYDDAPLDQLAEQVIAMIFMRLLQCRAEDYPDVSEFAAFCRRSVVDSQPTDFEAEVKLLDRLGRYTIKTHDGIEWHMRDLFSKPGLFVQDKDGVTHYYDKKGNTSKNPYFYRLGTQEEVNARFDLIQMRRLASSGSTGSVRDDDVSIASTSSVVSTRSTGPNTDAVSASAAAYAPVPTAGLVNQLASAVTFPVAPSSPLSQPGGAISSAPVAQREAVALLRQ